MLVHMDNHLYILNYSQMVHIIMGLIMKQNYSYDEIHGFRVVMHGAVQPSRAYRFG